MEKMSKILLIFVLTIGLFGVFLNPVLAQNLGGSSPTTTPSLGGSTSNLRGNASDQQVVKLNNPIKETSIPIIIGKAIQVIIGLVGTLALVMFIYAGFVWLTAQGNMEKIKKGRDTMLWAVIGLIVVFSSYAVLTYVFGLLKF